MGRELHALGGNYYGGVGVNFAPNPKWGCAQESYGEDPLLIGTLGIAVSRGAQETSLSSDNSPLPLRQGTVGRPMSPSQVSSVLLRA